MINHVVRGESSPAIVFVHGFGCALSDWDAQVAALSPRFRTVAVDLPGHGGSPGGPDDVGIDLYADAVISLLTGPSVLVGHSMGCRVVVEAAVRAPGAVAGLVLVDGSQFAPAMAPVLAQRFATAEGYTAMIGGMFQDMFTPKSDPAVAAAVIARAGALPYPVGAALMTAMQRYDVERFEAALSLVRVPALAVQSTYSNEKRERRTMAAGQSSPFLDMLRARVAGVRVEVVADTGHFPQLDEAGRTTALIEGFVAGLGAV